MERRYICIYIYTETEAFHPHLNSLVIHCPHPNPLEIKNSSPWKGSCISKPAILASKQRYYKPYVSTLPWNYHRTQKTVLSKTVLIHIYIYICKKKHSPLYKRLFVFGSGLQSLAIFETTSKSSFQDHRFFNGAFALHGGHPTGLKLSNHSHWGENEVWTGFKTNSETCELKFCHQTQTLKSASETQAIMKKQKKEWKITPRTKWAPTSYKQETPLTGVITPMTHLFSAIYRWYNSIYLFITGRCPSC